jgi:hypothetical protein
MTLRNLFGVGKRAQAGAPSAETALLAVRVDGDTVALIHARDVPCGVQPDVLIDAPATVTFEDFAGTLHRHHVPASGGWLHLSVRVHPNLGCQADAVVTARPEHAAGAAIGENDVAIRFEPFFLAGSDVPAQHPGRGLFARGLHFSGLVTPGNVLLSCECDVCGETFIARSFHAGFARSAYLYSGSGRYTMIVDEAVEGSPVPLAAGDPAALAALEARLPLAPDGTRFDALNAFRCPHCAAPYVDFAAFPEQRPGEYYALYLPDTPPIRFDQRGGGTPRS